MVLLIGGTGSSGKTNLAHTLMNMLQLPYFSLDHLMMGLFRSNPACGFTPDSDVGTINAVLWPIVLEMIKTSIENGFSVIYEGFQILPQNIAAIPPPYAESVQACFLCLGESYIAGNYGAIVEHRSIIETRSDIDSQAELMEKTRELIQSCRQYQQRACIVEQDYQSEIQALVETIVSSYRRT